MQLPSGSTGIRIQSQAGMAPQVVMGGNVAQPTAGQSYNAMVNSISSTIAYNRVMQPAIAANSLHPSDATSHQFYSLAIFALGDYHEAALAAHAVRSDVCARGF